MSLIPAPGRDVLDAQALRVVRAVLETGSITAAAIALGYSQPAVSQQLARLESRLGMPVVERVGRGVRLTEAGLVLARHSLVVETTLDAAAGELAELAGLRSGRVRIAAFPSASAAIVPSVLARMKARHPGITVTYREAEPPESVALVRDKSVDLALTFSYPGDAADPHRDSAQGLRVMELRHEEIRVVLPAAHPAAGSAAVDLSTLSGEDWIAGCPRCRGHLLELCDRNGFTPTIACETDNVAAVFGLVENGIGVAILPILAIESVGTRPGVAIRPTTSLDHRTVHAVTASGAERIPALAATLAALTAVVASAPGWCGN
ncbi:LysR family transcriptional regulator [Cryobacterium sp. MLB-32]|uniref:LysR family transcriptional regulator n=1 Tax=Cryobacterium sp. MLB-32 TaxID=1529318 RepID=UPI0004E6FBAD|nr:LysR family transcriptional regulator [Cryobacterium sp. MLB-32]KFF59872.1 LysR family transcriptional regulator [Cryobacterium sp. MLB-32]